MNKIDELIALLRKQENEDKKCRNIVLWMLAIIGTIAAVAGIAYAVYRFLTPDYLEDFEEDFEDEFEDAFETEEEAEEAPAEDKVPEEDEKEAKEAPVEEEKETSGE